MIKSRLRFKSADLGGPLLLCVLFCAVKYDLPFIMRSVLLMVAHHLLLGVGCCVLHVAGLLFVVCSLLLANMGLSPWSLSKVWTASRASTPRSVSPSPRLDPALSVLHL